MMTDRAFGTVWHDKIRTVIVNIKMIDVEQIRMTQFISNFELVPELVKALRIEYAIELDGHVYIS
jgi:hypothetical protein